MSLDEQHRIVVQKSAEFLMSSHNLAHRGLRQKLQVYTRHSSSKLLPTSFPFALLLLLFLGGIIINICSTFPLVRGHHMETGASRDLCACDVPGWDRFCRRRLMAKRTRPRGPRQAALACLR
mmetsp:Transcript_27495/g.75728  ORF Transcript_27495/g.75728 Transcript_27495/m.75728 type:complete len:122 (-) Transcript_27495:978-1343(-)